MQGSAAIQAASTLVDILRWRAAHQPAQRAYTFLSDGENNEKHITFAELDRQARTIAVEIQSHIPTGGRALLLYPPGLDYLAVVYASLYAGAIAIPLFPPKPNQGGRRGTRLKAILDDAQPAAVLTLSSMQELAAEMAAEQQTATRPKVIVTDCLDSTSADHWKSPALQSSDLAFLQYTSGSTATPKGVMLTHGNLLQNCKLIEGCFEQTGESHSVIWLPPYHDMGLIGGIIQPIYTGFPATLMSPVHFLQRPIRWLQAISRYHATTSGGPNFAYELCLRKVSPEQRLDLDLSSWRVAFNGAEPIRPDTLEQFSEFFSPCGFRRESFFPCYGLAEATLLVSAGMVHRAPVIRRFNEDTSGHSRSTGNGNFIPAEHGRPLVGCGRTLPGQQIVVVDPTTLKCCLPGQVGELWVSGPSVARGYWNAPEESARVFQASPAGVPDSTFLRTGDLGFVYEDELFITGRLKDLIIIRGQNHYPQDIELTVERSSPALRPGCGAAFAININAEEQLVIVQEIEREFRNTSVGLLTERVRQAIVQNHGVNPYAVMLLKTGGIPKTSSGKIQRSACREGFLKNALPALGTSMFSATLSIEKIDMSRDDVHACPQQERFALVQRYVRAQVADILRVELPEVDLRQPLLTLGIDSLMATELQHRMEVDLRVDLSNAGLLSHFSLDQITTEVLAAVVNRPVASSLNVGISSNHSLSHGQRALWYLQQIAPDSTAYNIVCGLRTKSRLAIPTLERAVRRLTDRHATLRTVFVPDNGEPLAQIEPGFAPRLQIENVPAGTAEVLVERLHAAADQPFDLQRGPMFRVHLFEGPEGEQTLLLVIHHMVTDFWSLAVLYRDLSELYRSESDGSPAELPRLDQHYADYVIWQAEMMNGSDGSRLWSYWQNKLHGELPILSLPTDKPRPSVQTWSGAVERVHLNSLTTNEVRQFCHAHGVTLYTLLLSVFQVLLSRHGGGTDLLVGSPFSGRSRSEFSNVVGYFINPVVLRANLSGNPRFQSFLAQVKQTVQEAFEHQALPFALLAERLQPARDPSRSPVFQTMFMWQQAPLVGKTNLTLLGLGESGAPMRLGTVPLESIEWNQRSAQFDVTLAAGEAQEKLYLLLQYNSDLFHKETIQRMLVRFRTLLTSILSAPQQRIHNLPMLDKVELQQILLAAQGPTGLVQDGDVEPLCIHTLFAKQASRTPTATALVFNEQKITYEELNRSASRLAHSLQKLGVGPEVPVAVCVERSPEMVIGMLGILKAGGAYVPLDPNYPRERLLTMLADSGAPVLITQRRISGFLIRPEGDPIRVVCLDSEPAESTEQTVHLPADLATDQNAAYIIYTSGSTGKPKGVVVQHGSVMNFFAAMDRNLGCRPEDTLLAVTSISFDISVLELFWTLTRGGRVVLMPEQTSLLQDAAIHEQAPKEIQFSLFYFASDSEDSQAAKYRLVTEGAKFADRHGFTAVWTPERHFHEFGGLYPNPSVMSAMLAGITDRIQIRAGSVVLPLHDPIRVVEEWALVDNLSNGRIGVAFASGWHANDFVFFPEHYADRKEVMYRQIQTVQHLWKGESVTAVSGVGKEIAIKIFPRPIQANLPIWITAAGNPETFVKAGQLGVGVLTHLLGQSLVEVAAKVRLYRETLQKSGHDPKSGHVTLMLHTFVGDDQDAVREIVRKPFTAYLRSSISLIEGLIKSLNLPLDLRQMSAADMNQLLTFAFDRYFENSALFGTLESCSSFVDGLKTIGIDEIACLIDFGVETTLALQQLEKLAVVKDRANATVSVKRKADDSLAIQVRRYQPSMLQCTPSFMGMVAHDPSVLKELQSLRVLMLGGEALSVALVQDLHTHLPAQIVNMYGPTETTIWSTTHHIDDAVNGIPIGRPILNTQVYILDDELQPVPIGHLGELYIGGAGVARGYLNQPATTAERFTPDPFGSIRGGRLYRTGDLVRLKRDGTIEFTGRADNQVKLRGFRIELAEIETLLSKHSSVCEAVAVIREDQPGDKRLVAYVVPREPNSLDVRALQDHLKTNLPAYMIPSLITTISALPVTPNGKVDRKALPAVQQIRREHDPEYIAPQNRLEQMIASTWRQVLQVDQIGINDNFFDRGGHSLLMAQVQSQLQTRLKKAIPLIKLLEHPTIGSLALYLRQEEQSTPRLNESMERAQRQLESRRQRRAFPATGVQ